MDRLKISGMGKFHELHHRLLPDVRIATDPLLTVANLYVTVDMLALGKELWKLYPEEWQTMSMSEIIKSHYGNEALEFVEALL